MLLPVYHCNKNRIDAHLIAFSRFVTSVCTADKVNLYEMRLHICDICNNVTCSNDEGYTCKWLYVSISLC